MGLRELDAQPFTLGLVVPDSSKGTPQGSLTEATNVMITDTGGIRQRFGLGRAITSGQPFDAPETFSYAFMHKDRLVMLDGQGNGHLYKAEYRRLLQLGAVTGGPVNAQGSATIQLNPTSPQDIYTYIAQPNSELTRFNGSQFSSLTAGTGPKCRYLTVGMSSQRLWAAGFNAGTNLAGQVVGPTTVAWSDPLEPEVWPTSNWQNFGLDGEPITGLVNFSGQMFVFSRNRYWVIYNLTTSDGVTTPNYREVTGAGLVQPGAVVTTEAGVFFLAEDGVYMTTGTQPVKVSEQINGLFTGQLPSWSTRSRLFPLPERNIKMMTSTKRSLYMVAGNVSESGKYGDILLAYSYANNTWSVYDLDPIRPIFLGAVRTQGISQPLVAGVGWDEEQKNFWPFVLNPRLHRDDYRKNIEVSVGMSWMTSSAELGYIAMDTMSVRRMDAWGLGAANVGIAVDFEDEPEQWQEVVFTVDDVDDVWGDGSDPEDVWGDGTDPLDVWREPPVDPVDYSRLRRPVHKYAYNLYGRGRYLAAHFHKLTSSEYFYIEPPRFTVAARGR